MDKQDHDSPSTANQVVSPDWGMAAIPVEIVAAFMNDKAKAVNPATWWQRAFELAHEDSERIDELVNGLSSAGASKDEATIASRVAIKSARSERFIKAGDFLSSAAAAQTAMLYAGFLLGINGYTPEMIEQMLSRARSEQARAAANKRHEENHAMRDQVRAHYLENKAKFKSKDAAAEAMAKKLVPLPFRTVRDYLKGI